MFSLLFLTACGQPNTGQMAEFGLMGFGTVYFISAIAQYLTVYFLNRKKMTFSDYLKSLWSHEKISMIAFMMSIPLTLLGLYISAFIIIIFSLGIAFYTVILVYLLKRYKYRVNYFNRYIPLIITIVYVLTMLAMRWAYYSHGIDLLSPIQMIWGWPTWIIFWFFS
jgi:hypothetical protein